MGRQTGRPKKQSHFELPGFRQEIRGKFIEFAQQHNSPGLQLLGTDVWLGKISLHQWAGSLNLSGTWVEEWAQDALDAWSASTAARETDNSPKPWWILGPPDPPAGTPLAKSPYRAGRYCPAPRKLESGEMDMAFPLPRDRDTDILVNWEEYGIKIRALLAPYWDACPRCGEAIDRATEKTEGFCRSCAKIRRVTIPRDCDLKIKCAALYHLSGKPTDKLVEAVKVSVSAEAMYGWLQEANALLDLKMRPRGRRTHEILR
jgi:hypothetical protein